MINSLECGCRIIVIDYLVDSCVMGEVGNYSLVCVSDLDFSVVVFPWKLLA